MQIYKHVCVCVCLCWANERWAQIKRKRDKHALAEASRNPPPRSAPHALHTYRASKHPLQRIELSEFARTNSTATVPSVLRQSSCICPKKGNTHCDRGDKQCPITTTSSIETRLPIANVYTCMCYVYTHTKIYTYICTFIYRYIRTCTLYKKHVHIHLHIYEATNPPPRSHVYICTHLYVCDYVITIQIVSVNLLNEAIRTFFLVFVLLLRFRIVQSTSSFSSPTVCNAKDSNDLLKTFIIHILQHHEGYELLWGNNDSRSRSLWKVTHLLPFEWDFVHMRNEMCDLKEGACVHTVHVKIQSTLPVTERAFTGMILVASTNWKIEVPWVDDLPLGRSGSLAHLAPERPEPSQRSSWR